MDPVIWASAPLKVLFTIDAHDCAVLHCKKPNPLAILFGFPVKTSQSIFDSHIPGFEEVNQMLIKGEVTIRAPRKKVWDFLTDPDQIGQCAPGVEKIEMIEPLKRYRGIVSVGLGAVKARFSGEVEVMELEEPNYAKIKAHGSASGSVADAVSEMRLSDGPGDSTILKWTADVTVSGQLASLASRLMVPVSQKLAQVFYEQVRKKIETENTAAASTG